MEPVKEESEDFKPNIPELEPVRLRECSVVLERICVREQGAGEEGSPNSMQGGGKEDGRSHSQCSLAASSTGKEACNLLTSVSRAAVRCRVSVESFQPLPQGRKHAICLQVYPMQLCAAESLWNPFSLFHREGSMQSAYKCIPCSCALQSLCGIPSASSTGKETCNLLTSVSRAAVRCRVSVESLKPLSQGRKHAICLQVYPVQLCAAESLWNPFSLFHR
ncbi:UNVERIFIED_CONTAM: hypothetical protein FKN15_025563 [Acipenser sinensis]